MTCGEPTAPPACEPDLRVACVVWAITVMTALLGAVLAPELLVMQVGLP